MRPGVHRCGNSSDGLPGEKPEQVDEVRRDVDRGPTAGELGIERPTCPCRFISSRWSDDEAERHVVVVRRNLLLGTLERRQQVADPEDERDRAVKVCFLRQLSELADLRHADAARLLQRKRNALSDQSLRELWHLGVATENKRELDLLFLNQLIARRIQLATESRCDFRALDVLRVRDRNHLDTASLQRIEIERDVPVARLKQRNLHRSYLHVISAEKRQRSTWLKKKLRQQENERRREYEDHKAQQQDTHQGKQRRRHLR